MKTVNKWGSPKVLGVDENCETSGGVHYLNSNICENINYNYTERYEKLSIKYILKSI